MEKFKSLGPSSFSGRESFKTGYEYFWVYNEFKPENFSLSELVEKNAVSKSSYGTFSIEDKVRIKEAISKMLQYVSSYGLSDKDELWVNFFENLKKLPREYRKIILDAL